MMSLCTDGAMVPPQPAARPAKIAKKIMIATLTSTDSKNGSRNMPPKDNPVSIMENIHKQCVDYGRESDNHVNYVKGANIAGFIKVADAMLAYGAV